MKTKAKFHFPYGSILALGFACVLFLLSYTPPETTAGFLRFGRGTIANQIGVWLALPWFSDLLLLWAKRIFLVSLLFGAVECFHEHLTHKIKCKANDLLAPSRKSTPPIFLIAALGILIPAFLFFRNVEHGFFWMDDLSNLSIFESPCLSLFEKIFHKTIDHIHPAFSAFFYGVYHLFGFHAFYFNIASLLLFSLSGTLVILLIMRLKVSSVAITLYIAVFYFWASWVEVLVGYYILYIYVFLSGWVGGLLLLLASGAVQGGRIPFVLLLPLFLFTVLLMSPIGIVLIALTVLSGLFLTIQRSRFKEHLFESRNFILCGVVALIVGGIYHVNSLNLPVNASGCHQNHLSLHSLISRLSHFPTHLPGFLGSYVFSSLIIPGNYALPMFGPSVPKIISFGLFFVFATGIVFAFARAPSHTRWNASAFLVLFLGTAALPVLGRDQDFSSGHVIYHYYAIMPFFWFVPMIVVLWDGLRIRDGQSRHFWIVTFLLIGGYLFCQEFSTDISAHGTRLIRTGRKRAAQIGAERRERLLSTSAPIRDALSTIPLDTIPLPDIPVSYFHTDEQKRRILYTGYQLREFCYLLTPEGKTLAFHTAKRFLPTAPLEGTPSLAQVIPNVVFDRIYQEEALQRIYLPFGVELVAQPIKGEDANKANGRFWIPCKLDVVAPATPPHGSGRGVHISATPPQEMDPSTQTLLYIEAHTSSKERHQALGAPIYLHLRFVGSPKNSHAPLRIQLPTDCDTTGWIVDLSGWLEFQLQHTIYRLDFELEGKDFIELSNIQIESGSPENK